jgi:tetratricopeptide (TPR) repeat protein
MEVTKETRRARWLCLAAAWLIAATLLFLHANAFRQDLELANNVGLRGAQVAPTPMKRVCPTMYADALMWVRNALDLAHGAGPQMRYTHADNAPYGREVHWNSGFAWLIVGAGSLRHLFTGEPLSVAIEQSLAWFNLPLLLGFIIILSVWVTRRAGAGAGVFLTLAMVGDTDFYAGFGPNYVDHHGLLAAAVLGLVLGGVFMGVGFWRTSTDAAQLLPSSIPMVRRAAVFSAICGGFGMWVSAATLVPAIAIMGIAGVVAMLVHARRAVTGGIQLDPGAWRLWGRVGAAVSGGFYLLEYFPSHLGLRLEVNHPLYAAGWWAGSEIIAQIAEWRAAPRPGFRFNWRRIGLALAAVALVPLIIAIGGGRVFVVFDPFVTRLSQHVAEGIRFVSAVKIFGWRNYQSEFVWIGVTVVLAVVAWWRARPADRLVVAFCSLMLGAATLMEFMQIRWMPSAAGPQITMVIIAIASLAGHRSKRVRWIAVGVASVTLCLPFAVSRIVQVEAAVANRSIDKTDSMQPIYRDIAAALRASQPNGPIVVLSSPNASVAIGYYGQFQTIGTLYWENLAGTKAAAEMFSAPTDLAARRLVRARGVTHIAMVSEDNFLAEYYDLLHPGSTQEALQNSFGYKLLVNLTLPMWLEQIPYDMPTDVPYRPTRVVLLKTHFGQPAAEELYEQALEDVDRNQPEAAEAKVDAALALDARSAEFWVAKTNLLLNRGKVDEAFTAVARAVETADPEQKYTVCSGEAVRFYNVHAHAAAVQLYHAAVTLRREPVMLNNLAWLLATSSDDKVRNGNEALLITQQLVRENPEVTYITAYAAALAECGRFQEATAEATRVLEVTRKTNDPKLIALAQRRLATYQSGKPWRE